MTSSLFTRRGLALLALAIGITGTALPAQEPLVLAKAYYATAAYEEALRALAATRPSSSPTEAAEVIAYRAYCLLALGRTHEARAVIESLVLVDPFFHPADDQVSPRVRAFFDDVRYPLLDDVAWQVYGSARDALERQDLALAAEGFGTAIRLTEELPTPLDAGMTELRALAAGFRDLAERAIAAQEQAEAGSGATGTAGADGVDTGGAAPVDDPDRIYSDENPDVVKPVVVSRPLPPWIPPAGAEGRSFSGVIELLVTREGKVEAAQILESIYPLYDSLLISVSRTWQFRPATRDGVPVRYRYRIAVRMGES